LFIVISLLAIHCSSLRTLERKREKGRKHGVVLIIQKKNGRQIKGELITVKQNSLLLLDSATGADVSIDSGQIKIITIVEKSRILKWMLIGGAIGGMIGSISGAASVEGEKISPFLIIFFPLAAFPVFERPKKMAEGAFIGLGTGVAIGGICGAAAGPNKTIRIEGMSKETIEKVLQKLRKKARIRDYK
jgi:hypothetical protein